MNNWKEWKQGMPIYTIAKQEVYSENGVVCPLCKGTGIIEDPFGGPISANCKGFLFGPDIHFTCKEGMIYKKVLHYVVKNYTLKSWAINQPEETLSRAELEYPFGGSKIYVFPCSIGLYESLEEAQIYCNKMNEGLE